VVVGAAEEAEAVGKDFESSFAEHESVEASTFLEDLEDQVLFFETVVFGELVLFGDGDEVFHRHALEFGDVDAIFFGGEGICDGFAEVNGGVICGGSCGRCSGAVEWSWQVGWGKLSCDLRCGGGVGGRFGNLQGGGCEWTWVGRFRKEQMGVTGGVEKGLVSRRLPVTAESEA
jgi:hypothetical protein